MSVIPGHPPSIDEGVLQRYLDDELDADERRAVTAALTTDPRARATLERLDRAGRAVADLVAQIAVPPTPTWTPPPRAVAARNGQQRQRRPGRLDGLRRAASILLLLAGAGLVVSPVGATLVRRAATWLGLSPEDPPAAATVADDALGPEITFAVRGPELVVEVAHRQAAGDLVLTPTPGDRVTARAGGPSGPGFLVTASGLRIDNAPTAVGDVHLGVPEDIPAVRLRIGDGAWVRIAVEGEDQEIRRSLGPPG